MVLAGVPGSGKSILAFHLLAQAARASGNAIHLASRRWRNGERTLLEVLEALEALLDDEGLDVLDPFHEPGRPPGNLARPRRFEVAAAINRLRSVRMRQRREEEH